MAPASNMSTVAQAARLLEVLKNLNRQEMQRLLKIGNLLILLAKRDHSNWALDVMSNWASGYVLIRDLYPSDTWGQMRVHSAGTCWWKLRLEDGTFVPMLEHYNITWVTEDSPDHDQLLAQLETHWEADSMKWYFAV
jgi:hypothetical protein